MEESKLSLFFKFLDVIDIVKDQITGSEYKKEEDPRYYVSQKTNRGPLTDTWVEDHWNNFQADPTNPQYRIMCAYKLCRVEFQYWGMQSKIEQYIQDLGKPFENNSC